MHVRLTGLAAALAAITAITPIASSAAAPRGFTAQDLVNMERIGSPVLAPDASRVVYTVRTTDLARNRGHVELWLQDVKTPHAAARQLTNNSASSTDPEWSASGDAIYFLSARSGSNQVWRLPVNGGEAQRVTDLPVDVENFRLSPTGDRIALSLAVYRDCADLACTAARLDDAEKHKSRGMLYHRLFVRHWDTWADGRTNVLYSAPLDAAGRVSGAPVSLTGTIDGDVPSKPFGDHEEYRFSPDGKTILFSVRVAGQTEAWSTNFDLYSVPDAGGSAPRNLTAGNLAWDTKGTVAPDGKTIAYLAMARPGFEADRYQIMLMDAASGRTRKLAEQWDRSANNLRWSADGKALIVDAEDMGQH
jgi:dipeptidyl aminopeptidase/acylaminoacyl peptidase